jgi:hypothetical protein
MAGQRRVGGRQGVRRGAAAGRPRRGTRRQHARGPARIGAEDGTRARSPRGPADETVASVPRRGIRAGSPGQRTAPPGAGHGRGRSHVRRGSRVMKDPRRPSRLRRRSVQTQLRCSRAGQAPIGPIGGGNAHPEANHETSKEDRTQACCPEEEGAKAPRPRQSVSHHEARILGPSLGGPRDGAGVALHTRSWPVRASCSAKTPRASIGLPQLRSM